MNEISKMKRNIGPFVIENIFFDEDFFVQPFYDIENLNEYLDYANNDMYTHQKLVSNNGDHNETNVTFENESNIGGESYLEKDPYSQE